MIFILGIFRVVQYELCINKWLATSDGSGEVRELLNYFIMILGPRLTGVRSTPTVTMLPEAVKYVVNDAGPSTRPKVVLFCIYLPAKEFLNL